MLSTSWESRQVKTISLLCVLYKTSPVAYTAIAKADKAAVDTRTIYQLRPACYRKYPSRASPKTTVDAQLIDCSPFAPKDKA